jgi:hypothetical protein
MDSNVHAGSGERALQKHFIEEAIRFDGTEYYTERQRPPPITGTE